MLPHDSVFKETIYKALCACVGLNPSASEAKTMIREAYAEPENTPRPGRNADVIYWSAYPDDSIEDPEYVGLIPKNNHQLDSYIGRPLVFALMVVCYGPNSEGYASAIRSNMYLDGGKTARSILRNKMIYPIPKPPPPDYLYEPEGSLWRKRVDQKILLTVVHQESGDIGGSVQSGPWVIIRH